MNESGTFKGVSHIVDFFFCSPNLICYTSGASFPSYMLPDTSKKSRQKTRVVKKSQSPVYNHAMVFDGFRAGEVREACCELTVWDHHKLSNQFLGGVRICSGTGTGVFTVSPGVGRYRFKS